MFSLKSRQDKFRLVFPKEFLDEDLIAKYSKILADAHSFYTEPIEFLNETIQSVQVLGFQGGTTIQQQSYRGSQSTDSSRIQENRFMFPSGEYNYRSPVSPISLIDKQINVVFRHTLGFINYFLLFENFFKQYERDTQYKELIPALYIDIMDHTGAVYSRVKLDSPIIDSMDMLDLNYTQPVASSQTFQVTFKYSNIEFEFIEENDERTDDTLQPIIVNGNN